MQAKLGKRKRENVKSKCWHYGEICHTDFLCLQKNAATKAAHAVTEDDRWNLVLYDEPAKHLIHHV